MTDHKIHERTEEEARKQAKIEHSHLIHGTYLTCEINDDGWHPKEREEQIQRDGEEERECDPHHHRRWRGWKKDMDNT